VYVSSTRKTKANTKAEKQRQLKLTINKIPAAERETDKRNDETTPRLREAAMRSTLCCNDTTAK